MSHLKRQLAQPWVSIETKVTKKYALTNIQEDRLTQVIFSISLAAFVSFISSSAAYFTSGNYNYGWIYLLGGLFFCFLAITSGATWVAQGN